MKTKTPPKSRSPLHTPRTSNSRPGQEKRDLAKLLFTRNDMTKKEVAKKVGISEKTIGKWANDGKWEDQRKSLLVTKDTELRNLIDQLSEINAYIKTKPEGQRYANSAEADTVGKITSAIRKLTTDAGLTEVLEISTQILSFCQKNFPENLNTLIPILDTYVQSHLK